MIDHTISLTFPDFSYPVYVGNDIYDNLQLLKSHIHGQQVLIVTQQNIAAHYLLRLQTALQNYQCDFVNLQNGEQHKTLTEWAKIIDVLIQHHHERSTTLIALGGGIVGDMTGFAAACYMRGVNYIHIPTSLIAQVDSSLGGKVGVNHALGKNMMGAFHHPQCVITDYALLRTLPQREYIAGLAEVIKAALIWDENFFSWLENNVDAVLAKDPGILQHLIATSVKIKSEIVTQDETEQGLRRILNLGHTFGHAIETALEYRGILHGEAVAIGMRMAVEISREHCGLTSEAEQRIQLLLQAYGLYHFDFTIPPIAELLAIMARDKKVVAGKLTLILLESIGNAKITAVDKLTVQA